MNLSLPMAMLLAVAPIVGLILPLARASRAASLAAIGLALAGTALAAVASRGTGRVPAAAVVITLYAPLTPLLLEQGPTSAAAVFSPVAAVLAALLARAPAAAGGLLLLLGPVAWLHAGQHAALLAVAAGAGLALGSTAREGMVATRPALPSRSSPSHDAPTRMITPPSKPRWLEDEAGAGAPPDGSTTSPRPGAPAEDEPRTPVPPGLLRWEMETSARGLTQLLEHLSTRPLPDAVRDEVAAALRSARSLDETLRDALDQLHRSTTPAAVRPHVLLAVADVMDELQLLSSLRHLDVTLMPWRQQPLAALPTLALALVDLDRPGFDGLSLATALKPRCRVVGIVSPGAKPPPGIADVLARPVDPALVAARLPA